MGVIFKEEGRLEEAVAAYEKALQVGDGDYAAWLHS